MKLPLEYVLPAFTNERDLLAARINFQLAEFADICGWARVASPLFEFIEDICYDADRREAELMDVAFEMQQMQKTLRSIYHVDENNRVVYCK